MATRIIEDVSSPASRSNIGPASSAILPLIEIVNGLGRVIRLLELLDWVERARALTTEIETTADSDPTLLHALASHDIRFRDPEFSGNASGGIREVLTETIEMVRRAQVGAEYLRGPVTDAMGEAA